MVERDPTSMHRETMADPGKWTEGLDRMPRGLPPGHLLCHPSTAP